MPVTNVFDGHFERRPTTFRNWVTADGSPGRRRGDFVAERNGIICMSAWPVPGRTALIMRRLKALGHHFIVRFHLRCANRLDVRAGPCVTGDPVNEAQAFV